MYCHNDPINRYDVLGLNDKLKKKFEDYQWEVHQENGFIQILALPKSGVYESVGD